MIDRSTDIPLEDSTDDKPINRIELRRATQRLLEIMGRMRGTPITSEKARKLTKVSGVLGGLEDAMWRALQSQFEREQKK